MATIAPPTRAGKVPSLIIVATALLFAVFAPVGRQGVALFGAAFLVFAAISIRIRSAAATHLTLFCALTMLGFWLPLGYSQLAFGVALLAYAAITRLWLGDGWAWLRRGTFGWDVRALVIATVALSSAALVLWFALLKPDVGDMVRQFLPSRNVSPSLLACGAVGFAMVNAAVEEAAYRGILMHALDAALGEGAASLILQAAAFGILHIHGFPRGAVGVGLAAIYGLMLGVVRRRARGLFAPWLAHVFADVTIVAILFFLARGK